MMNLRSSLYHIIPAEDPGVYKIKEVPWLVGDKDSLQRWIDNPECFS